MKIGIVTVFAVPNYGAMLQSYALATYLRRQGHDAEIIDYRQADLAKLYRFRLKFPPPIKHWLRLRRCETFVETRIPKSKQRLATARDVGDHAGNYDAIITGSDQVWFTGPVQYYDPVFFLDFPAPSTRKISYAASAGGTKSFGEYTERIRRTLSNFTAVGVRDSHTASLVEPLMEREPVRTVDPTFLHDFSELLSSESPSAEPYVLVFGNLTGDSEGVVRDVSKQTGIRKVVSLQYPCATATLRIASPGPEEWLNWFKHASFVVTSYFHGTAFAVNFQRPFLSIPTPGRRLKVETLLQPLELSDRCLSDDTRSAVSALVSEPIRWDMAGDKLKCQTANSKEFLKTALR